MRRSSAEQIKRFSQLLLSAGLVCTVRKTRGDDIDAACGQLAGDVVDRTHVLTRRPTALSPSLGEKGISGNGEHDASESTIKMS